MTAASPLISVLLPIRNAERTIEAAIDSVLGQSLRDFELLAIDDHSTDGTQTIIERMAALDSRIKVLAATGTGVTAALNQGLRLTSGRYVARQDADDVSLRERFERQIAFLERHADVCGVGCAATTIDEQGREGRSLPTRHGARAVREGIHTVKVTPVHGAMMMRTASLMAVGGYREAFRSCQDFDLWLRLLERCELDNLQERLYLWRLTGTSAYGARRVTQLMYGGIAQAFAIERSRFGEDSYTLLEETGDDFDALARRYRLRGLLHACWGHLLLRGVDDKSLARQHLRLAVAHGQRDARTIWWCGWTALGLPWPGRGPLRPEATGQVSQGTSR